MRSRRQFLAQLGLGAGASLLGPLALRLAGQGPERPLRFVFVMAPTGSFDIYNMKLPDYPEEKVHAPADVDRPLTRLPEMLSPLEPHRDRMLMIRSLNHYYRINGSGDHSAGFVNLSGVRRAGQLAEKDGPQGITVDQYLAATVGRDTPERSLLFSVQQPGKARSLFAEGPGRIAQPFQNPREMHARLFGGAASDSRHQRDALLRDAMREDANRLLAEFRGPERAPLEQYLAALEDYDRRREAGGVAQCGEAPSAPDGEATEDQLESYFRQAALALGCGMTRVVAGQIFTGNTHGNAYEYHRIHRDTELGGRPTMKEVEPHGGGRGDERRIETRILHRFHASLIAEMVDTLQSLPEGEGSVLDRTVIVMSCDGGATRGAHHVSGGRFPIFLIAGRDVPFRTGRFIQYETPTERDLAAHHLIDFWDTLLAVAGVDPRAFATTGGDVGLVQPRNGPIESLLA